MKSKKKGTKKLKVYFASPLGFSPILAPCMKVIVEKLESLGHTVINPWDENYDAHAARANQENTQGAALVFGSIVGENNERLIRGADILLAYLDGTEPDSGTVAELGYAAGMGKKCYGLRADFRSVGELPHIPINLQVHFFINHSGGTLFRSIEEISF